MPVLNADNRVSRYIASVFFFFLREFTAIAAFVSSPLPSGALQTQNGVPVAARSYISELCNSEILSFAPVHHCPGGSDCATACNSRIASREFPSAVTLGNRAIPFIYAPPCDGRKKNGRTTHGQSARQRADVANPPARHNCRENFAQRLPK